MDKHGVEQLAWDGRLDAERHYRYYGRLTTEYRRLYFCVSILLAVSAFAAGSTLVFQAHPFISAALAFVATACSIALMVADLSTKAAQADAASKHFSRVSIEWKRLWWHRFTEDAMERALWIEMFADSGPEVDIGEKMDLNIECGREAISVVSAEYGQRDEQT